MHAALNSEKPTHPVAIRVGEHMTVGCLHRVPPSELDAPCELH